MGPGRRIARSRVTLAAAFVGACIVALAVVEGLASLFLLARDLATGPVESLAERRHTRYDADLGWVNVPGLRLRDFYGPGLDLSINGAGFRGTREVARQVPAGKLRVVCSGDSFTLGYGVGDGDTWCAQLEANDARLETVNMGQGGYGVGQAYLWFSRDADFDLDLHVFAFIGGDFGRMLEDQFLGYPKPRLRARAGALVVENVPVPRGAYRVPWLVERRAALAELRSWQLLDGFVGGLAEESPRVPGELPQLVRAVFEELLRRNEEKGSGLVLVYIPLLSERTNTKNDRLRALLGGIAAQAGIPYVDLADDLRELSQPDAEALYIAAGTAAFEGAEGHLTRAGNRWVAQHLVAPIEAALAQRTARVAGDARVP